jgi:ATP-binding cassette subfamily F protein uup
MRVGLLGNNGSGKSTLLKLLAKTIEPDKGTVTHAEDLQVVYFDQHREQLNPTFTLRETMLDSGDHVTYRERPMHIVSWAKRFQFRAEQLDLRIDRLSGGEQARAVIAKLMLKPADVLLLDEPTNDLDIPTLEVLEESMQDFPGAMVLVTHDRHLLTQICTTFIGLDGQGTHGYFAEYEQWEGWLTSQSQEKSQKTKAASREDTAPKKPSAKNRPTKSNRNSTPSRNAFSKPRLNSKCGGRKPKTPPTSLNMQSFSKHMMDFMKPKKKSNSSIPDGQSLKPSCKENR